MTILTKHINLSSYIYSLTGPPFSYSLGNTITIPLHFPELLLQKDSDLFIKQASFSSNYTLSPSSDNVFYTVYFKFKDIADSNQISHLNHDAHFCISPKQFQDHSTCLFHVLPDYHVGKVLKSVRRLQMDCIVELNVSGTTVNAANGQFPFPTLTITLLVDDQHT